MCVSGQVRRRCIACAMLVSFCGSPLAFAATHHAAKSDPWTEALRQRQIFEAAVPGTHTREAYSRVMDRFRAIYHDNPGEPHAARAVQQVAELLVEQGHELNDRKSLHDAAGQYEFLAKAYPGGSLAPDALGKAFELLGPAEADDPVEARKVRAALQKDYPRSPAAHAAVKPPKTTPIPVEENVAPPRAAEPTRTAAAIPERVGPPETPRSQQVIPVASREEPTRAPGPVAMVTGIRHWSTATYTRVAIDLGADVQYEAARVENPDRIFFDLHHARLAPELSGKTFAVTDDGFLTKIRAAQFSDDVTRVVLDVHQVTDYSAFLLPNPSRLIIDIHGKEPGTASRAQGADTTEQATVLQPSQPRGSAAPRESVVPIERRAPSSSDNTQASSLPPMPVTDGSASFGLPSKREGTKTATVAPPRVVISSKPTTAKPVPNTVTTRTGATPVEVAAVSAQPGKVEATKHPTSQPIAEKSKPAAKRDADTADTEEAAATEPPAPSAKSHYVKPARHVKGAPAEAPPPTADGETSMMRALGLKIGRIVIDAGHGGHDSGTLGADGIEEKDVVLDVALRLGRLLHDRLGAEIVYTRADDTFIPLETRTAIANKAQADLFISVHANSSPDASARGVEVYYLNFTSDPDAMRVAARENAVSNESVHELSDLVKKIALRDKIDESKELAADVDQSLYAGLAKGNDGLKDRGVKRAPFVVLIGANMPSILAEISFVTNPEDASQLRTGNYRQRVAESLYRGIARYAQGINGTKDKSRTERASAGGR